jgi:plasmid stabilization system protein ParE
VTSAYHLTPVAQAGYQRIVIDVEDYFGISVAHRVETAIERALAQLADMPRSGHVRVDLTQDPTLRFWSVGPTLIAYRQRSSGIQVLMIGRGAMDWGRLLAPPGDESAEINASVRTHPMRLATES